MRIRGAANLPFLLTLSSAWLAAVMLLPDQRAAKAKVDFNRDILPIISDKCFKCHGPDSASRMADLRLDRSESAFSGRHEQWAIVPHQPEKSLVVERINDSNAPMPPADSGKTLTQREKETIRQWIEEGAQYAKLWSFESLPKAVPAPKVAGPWPNDDIDRFILDRLNKEKLSPSKPATKERWLRRVTLDLTGLPPTQGEIADFNADTSKEAYEKVADRLLANPHFGERQAVEWLDAARYSDSYGYQSDLLSPTWPYRDWVVKAFNENLPYDRFLTDQIAGDLLKNPTRDERLATAFNRLHRQSNEGGSIAEEFKTVYASDRVDTFGAAVLGLTLGCARCHDHKFDPITQRDYYQFFSYFNSIDEYGLLLSTEIVPTPSLLLPTVAQSGMLKLRTIQNEQAVKNLADADKAASPDFMAWIEKRPIEPAIPGLLARINLDSIRQGRFANSVGGASFGEQIGTVAMVDGHEGKAIQLDGDNGIAIRNLPGRERYDTFTWSFWLQDPGAKGPVVLLHRTGGTDVGFCGFDLMLEDGYLTARVMRHWPGNAVAVRATHPLPKGKWSHVAWSWDGGGLSTGIRLYVDGKLTETMAIEKHLWKKISAYGDLGPSRGDWSFGQRFRGAGFKGGKLDDIAFADRVLSEAEVAQLYDGHSLRDMLRDPQHHLWDLRNYYALAISEPVAKARREMLLAQKRLADVEEGVYEVSVMEDTPTAIPAYVLARGAYDAPKNDENKVVRDTPKSLPPLNPTGKNDRLALANWVTRPNNPLTARVAVNRLWQMVFGTGLVETSENFGSQGSQPTHPELLDYLARQFIDSGWNVKAMLRRMVLSSTYRQDSAQTKKLIAADPHNRLYARGPSGRLPAEMIRDTVLAASGLLDTRIGGAPVNPYQPAGIWQENNTMSPAFVQSKGRDLYRRSLYSTWKRTTPVPSMMLFDANSREACMVRRPSTDTPLQALVLLNDVQFVEASRVLAERILRNQGNDRDRIATAFIRLAGREPDSRELQILAQTLREQRAQFAEDPAGAKKLASSGDSKSANLAPVDVAAMTVTVQTIMNSDAVIWKR